MSLFNFGKKKETKESGCCCCGGSCSTAPVAEEKANVCCGESVDGICCVKVLGSGCKNCHTLFENTKTAVAETGLNIEVEYVTDMQKIMEYGVMSMPALVVNEKVVSMGKVLKASEVKALLSEI